MPQIKELSVTVRFASNPASYHLIEVIQAAPGAEKYDILNTCLQISNECPKEIVAKLAAHIEGLGV